MIKCVAFDLDDTLVYLNTSTDEILEKTYAAVDLGTITKLDFIEANQKAFKLLYKAYLNQEILLSQFGVLIWYELLADLNIMPSPRLVADLYGTFFDITLKHLYVQSDANEVLASLKALGLKVCIISNGAFMERLRKLEETELLDKVDLLISSDLAGKDKPASSPFELVLKYLKIEKHEILYVGDNQEEDIIGARNFGIEHLLFAPKTSNSKGINKVATLSEVLNYINKD